MQPFIKILIVKLLLVRDSFNIEESYSCFFAESSQWKLFREIENGDI